MKAYFGSRISQNQTRTPDGFLIAHNVPIARTGWYQYLAHEIGLDGDDVVDVYRDPEEVFSPAAMSSFEGKPVTNNHPPEGVVPSNSSTYTKGVITNVRPGKGDDDDLLLADLIAHDEQLINDILNGKREVSAGYECDYEPNEDGSYSQKNIVGNHVALVDAGRAGDRVRIQDRQSVPRGVKDMRDDIYVDGRVCTSDASCDEYKNKDGTFKNGFDGAVKYFQCKGYDKETATKIAGKIAASKGKDEEPEKTKARDSRMSLKKALRKPLHASRVLMAEGWRSFVSDADPEEIAEAMDEVAEELRGGDDTPAEEPKEKQPTGDDTEGQSEIDELKKQVAALTELVKSLKPKADDEDPEKALDDAIKQMEDPEDDEDDESQTIEPTNDEEGPVSDPEDRPQSGFKAADSASAVAYLKTMKKAIAKLKDPAEKKMMVDAALKAVNGRPSRPSNTYQKMTKPKKTTSDTKQIVDPSELGKKWMKAKNPHYKDRV